MSSNIDDLREKALKHGAIKLCRSNIRDKKWCVIYKGVRINFGQYGHGDYTTHHDKTKQRSMWGF
ncbi:MAG TPA: hypothetical protein VN703_00210, partial [Candidatus Sulfopaludibacter sp.]|nr:hypothetical protein [Candidatus Sulfopaludibacter sp.]